MQNIISMEVSGYMNQRDFVVKYIQEMLHTVLLLKTQNILKPNKKIEKSYLQKHVLLHLAQCFLRYTNHRTLFT